MSWKDTYSTVKFFLSWTKKFFVLVMVALVIFFALGIILWFRSHESFWFYVLCICLPALLALATVLWILFKSGYMKIAIQLGYRGHYGPDSIAGLAFIESTTNKVLLNLQTESPWENMWCLPGGYYNPDKGDKDPSGTAVRRVREIVDIELVYAAKVAQTNGSPDYLQMVIDNGHGPIHDNLYQLLKQGSSTISEEDIPERDDVKWCSLDDVRSGRIPVPDHMKEIINCLLDRRANRSSVRSWDIVPDYERYWLERSMPT